MDDHYQLILTGGNVSVSLEATTVIGCQREVQGVTKGCKWSCRLNTKDETG